MKKYPIALLALLLVSACQVTVDQPEVPILDEQAVLALFEHWNESLQTGDPDAVAQNYAVNAILLPTVSDRVRTNHAEIADYFVYFLSYQPFGVINEYHIRRVGDVIVNSGIYTFTLTDAEGETSDVQARYSFVYAMEEGEWKIIEHHSSTMPGQD